MLRKLSIAAALSMLGLLSSAPESNATIYTFDILSHPDGSERTPNYGLRLDGLEKYVSNGSQGTWAWDDVWTFNFGGVFAPAQVCTDCGMTAVYDSITKEFKISGVAFGGKDVGDFSDPSGRIQIDFTYTNVMATIEMAGGFTFPTFTLDQAWKNGGGTGSGTVTFLDDITSILTKDVKVDLGINKNNVGYFIFDDDDHRLNNAHGAAFCTNNPNACDLPVGRGWVTFTGATDSDGNVIRSDEDKRKTRDFLFTDPAVSVPEPGSLALLGAGLLSLGMAVRKRRSVA